MQYKFTVVPQGMFPVQAQGKIDNGQFFHFKQRGTHATLTILNRPISDLPDLPRQPAWLSRLCLHLAKALNMVPKVIAVYEKDVEALSWDESDVETKVMPAFRALLDIHEEQLRDRR